MPARVLADRLAVECVLSDGSRFTTDLSGLPCPRLAADLAVGLAGLVHPAGPLNTKTTIRGYRCAVGQLARFLHGAGFVGGADELSRARLVEFWLATRPHWESMTRAVLRSLDAQTGVLRQEVREHLTGRALQHVRDRDRQPFQPYSDSEWTRLLECCLTVTRTARSQQEAATAAGQAAQDPREVGWSPDNHLHLLLQKGPLKTAEIANYLGCTEQDLWRAGGVTRTARLLFPTVEVALAYRLLLGMTTGIVPDGLDDLDLNDVDWAGDTTVLLNYVKGRTGPESMTLPKSGARVLRQWLRHSALLRRFAPEEIRSRLWLAYAPLAAGSHAIFVATFQRHTVRRWVDAHQLKADDGTPLRIHKHRLRTTFAHRRDKSRWTGRTTIDPNRSAKVEGDHYLSTLSPAEQDAVDAVIEQAQADLVRKAHTPLVLDTEQTTQAAAALPVRVADMELTDEVITELVGGQRDVFTAACANQLAGLHGPKGQPCPARPWVCLLCPLAVFAPRHAPNLLRLKAFFTRQFQQMPLEQFMAVFGPYARCLDEQILPRFPEAVLAAAAHQVGDCDEELPLRPEERTT
jgi:hypothetical protein